VVEAGDLYLDLSKHRVTDETMALLVASPRSASVPAASTPCSPAST
jgi:glucose-6-phosphate isomerase